MSDTPAIEAAGLVKHYGKTKALDGLDLTVPLGTVSSISDPSCSCTDSLLRRCSEGGDF